MGVRLLVCGGRDYEDTDTIDATLDRIRQECGEIDTLIHGCASGADRAAGTYARTRFIPEYRFPANWKPKGEDGPLDKAAGFRRNELMLAIGKPDIVVAFPGNRGTAHMVEKSLPYNIEVRLVDFGGNQGVIHRGRNFLTWPINPIDQVKAVHRPLRRRVIIGITKPDATIAQCQPHPLAARYVFITKATST